MKIAVPKETFPGETRAGIIPQSVEKLAARGAEIAVEAGLGVAAGYADAAYEKAGAQVVADRAALLSQADMVLRIRKTDAAELDTLKKGAIHVSLLDPFNEKPLVEKMAAAGVTGICLELIPRTTLAQKMDVLSSQANLAGYVAVIIAAERLNKVFPMMMTPAGTIAPSRVFIIGAGVAGLQAIATAKRLGARVDAFDTRPAVAEQVQSLGAKFLKVDLGETGETKDGYAKQLTEEQMAIQREAMAKQCELSDVVITTAQVFGRKAPTIITADMVERMRPGTIVVDLAVETGGNVEGVELDKEVVKNGVTLVGLGNLPGRVAAHSSQMFSSNLTNFIEHFWDKDAKAFALKREDEIIQGCLVTFENEIVHTMLKERYGA